MQLLVIVTLIFTAVLVVVLAVSLTVVLVLLWRIGRGLAETRNALATVARRSEILTPHLERLRGPCAEAAEAMTHIEECLASADERLRATVKRSHAPTH